MAELRALRNAPLVTRIGTTASDFQAAGCSSAAAHPELPGDLAAAPDPVLAAALASFSHKLRAVVVLDTELNSGERTTAEIARTTPRRSTPRIRNQRPPPHPHPTHS
jgi:hypothetical protein